MAVSYVGMAVWYCLSTLRLQDGLSALLSETSQVIQPKEAVWDEKWCSRTACYACAAGCAHTGTEQDYHDLVQLQTMPTLAHSSSTTLTHGRIWCLAADVRTPLPE